jgi:hypothetical protein
MTINLKKIVKQSCLKTKIKCLKQYFTNPVIKQKSNMIIIIIIKKVMKIFKIHITALTKIKIH